MTHQEADSAGINHRDFFEVQYQARFAGVQQVLDGLVGAIERRSQVQLAAQFDQLHLILRAHVDFHHPLLELASFSLACACLALHCLLKFALKLEDWWQICKSAVTSHRVLETNWGRRTVAQRPSLKIDLNLLAVELFAAQELGPRARRIARAVSEALPGTFVNIYTVGRFAGEEAWILRAWAGGES